MTVYACIILLSIALDDIASIKTVFNDTVWNISVIPTQDNISLEDGDRILLSFTPNVSLDSNLTESGVFIRNVTFVYIIDDDSKCSYTINYNVLPIITVIITLQT